MKRTFLAFVNRRYVHIGGTPSCAAESLPPVDFDFCDPEVKLSEITRIFLAKVGAADFSDWTQAEEWEQRVSETETDIDAIRCLTVIGDKPAPNTTKKDISGGRKFNTRKDHTINATVDEVTPANHAFLQAVESGKRYKMWYETAGGFMFGGNSGIAIEISGDMLLPRGAGETMSYAYVITWVSPTTEQRCTSPIFGQTVLGTVSFDTMVTFADDATPSQGACTYALAGGTNAVAKFEYTDINPLVDTGGIVMTIKVGGVLKLTCNMFNDFLGQPFRFTDALGVSHSGVIASGDVLFA